jgi:hypothetical protein
MVKMVWTTTLGVGHGIKKPFTIKTRLIMKCLKGPHRFGKLEMRLIFILLRKLLGTIQKL